MSKRVAVRAGAQLESRAFVRNGLLLLEPQAFGFLFFGPRTQENQEIGNVVVVHIDGPLDHHDEGWFDSYDAIRARVRSACESQATSIVLKIDSPGGEASGCFETAREIRAMCAEAGKSLYAQCERQACSAAYALASAASIVSASETAVVGSIGVISTRYDYSEQNAAHGVRVAFITSGARKADGHPDLALTEAELKDSQLLVDGLAEKFFALVADHRGIDADAIRAQEARLCLADVAVKSGLVDQVQSFDELIAELQKPDAEEQMIIKKNAQAGAAAEAEDDKDKTPYEKARAALEELAAGDGAEAEKAKKALAAMDDDGDGDKDKPKDGDGDGDKDKDAAAKDDENCAAGATTVVELAQVVNRMGAKMSALEQSNRSFRVKELLDARLDISKELRKTLTTKGVDEVRAILAGIPKPKTPPAPITTVAATQGAKQGTGQESRMPLSAKQELDIAMGLVETKPGVVSSEFKLQLGVIQPESDTQH